VVFLTTGHMQESVITGAGVHLHSERPAAG
jgi:hypothetical protein